MNFLAHLHLGRHWPTMEAAGNLTADHCKTGGNAAFRRGVRAHRRIDAFTDTHALVAEARALFPGTYRRFGGVLSDLVFDHCLARTWQDWFDDGEHDAFVRGQLNRMQDQSEALPDGAVEMIDRMQRGQWIQTYAHIAGMRVTIERMVKHRPFAARMLGAEAIMEARYGEFLTIFRAFYPQLQALCRSEPRTDD